MNRAVFFDRDGTLMKDVDYCGDVRDVQVFAGAADALQRLKARGFKLIVITNQSGIGRGYFNEADYRSVHAEFLHQLGDALIDATYYCPHTPQENCSCRKPLPQLVLDAAREHQIDLARSFFVGDKATDIECGHAAGVRTILVETGYGGAQKDSQPNWRTRDLAGAAEIILANE